MKKIGIFLLALMSFSFFIIFGSSTNAPALADAYKIQITTTANYSALDSDLANGVFSAGYADNEVITFEANLYANDSEVTYADLTYVWKDTTTASNPIEICNTKYLLLSKKITPEEGVTMMVGTKHYEVTITGSGINLSFTLMVEITDNADHEIVTTQISRPLEFQSGMYLINKKTEKFTVQAILSKAKVDCTINWFLKTPNSSTYDLIKENDDYDFIPSKVINSKSGFGVYKLYASAQSSSVLYVSKVIYFKAVAGELNSDLNNYAISKKVINNTKAELEAFTFTLENASTDGLDFDKILWYINDVKMGKGESFSYEPTTAETFTVKVQYKGTILTPIKELSVTPHTTGALKLILYIAGGVAVLTIIFVISVKRLNKKRDVVW